MHIDLPAEQQSFIENLVASGRFSSENEAMCESVRLLISREQLKQKVQVGIEQADRGVLFDHDTVFGQLRMMATDIRQL
jgi:putative addiction module CopG family antidote